MKSKREIERTLKENKGADFVLPMTWDVMFEQMFISEEAMPLLECIISIFGNVDIKDVKGKVRLLPNQYRTLRVKYGDTYIKRAFTELTNYIKFLEKNQDIPKYKTKLKDYMSKTHNLILDSGWVYEKCKSFICKDRIKIPLNPYTIEDFNTAKEYIKMIPKDIRENAFDVKMLMMKFPELKEVDYDE